MQTQGRKRWKVWGPPPRKPGRDPFGRGKNGDKIESDELGEEPLTDTWLEPGDILYIPIGFPHATSTEEIGEGFGDHGEISCHVTLGLDTYFYGICYCTLRAMALGRAKTRDTVNLFEASEEVHRRLFSPLPFGFLCPQGLDYNSDDFCRRIISELQAVNEAAAVCSGVETPSLGNDESLQECVQFLVKHWHTLISLEKYENVIEPSNKFSPTSAQAKLNRITKNQKEEAAQKRMVAFCSGR